MPKQDQKQELKVFPKVYVAYGFVDEQQVQVFSLYADSVLIKFYDQYPSAKPSSVLVASYDINQLV